MVLDIELFRKEKGGDPDIVRKSEQRRFHDTANVDKVIECDEKWRQARYEVDQYNKQKNGASKAIGKAMKASKGAADAPSGEDDVSWVEQLDLLTLDLGKISLSATSASPETFSVAALKRVSTVIDERRQLAIERMEQLENDRGEALKLIGNIVHDSVPISKDEANNEVVRTVGEERKPAADEKLESHVDLIEMIDGVDMVRGCGAAGGRAYYLRGAAVHLQYALIQAAMTDLTTNHDFTAMYTPFFLRKDVMGEVAQLSDFDDTLYKVQAKSQDEKAAADSTDEKYLIATSEQSLAAYHRNEWIPVEDLPLKYAGISTCFRQEVGCHGRDTRGIFRVHQFEKVEQFIVCAPDESWKLFEEMISHAEDFFKQLGFRYRVVAIVSGELNNAAAKKLDIEAYFPGSAAYRELVSCSNCLDYQSRRLKVRYGRSKKTNQAAEFCHMLNSTMCAVTRAICCLLETHQTKEGILVPDLLKPYMPKKYKNLIPFVKKSAKQIEDELKEQQEAEKLAKKSGKGDGGKK